MSNKQFTIKGLPNDLLTDEVVNERKLKVSNDNDRNTDSITASLLNEISVTNKGILSQLILLNARIEEAFNTKIKEMDIE